MAERFDPTGWRHRARRRLPETESPEALMREWVIAEQDARSCDVERAERGRNRCRALRGTARRRWPSMLPELPMPERR